MLNLDSTFPTTPITIQCHDNPDADSIASAFALYTYFQGKGKDAKIIYSGSAAISKPNLVKMVELLSVPLEHMPEPYPVETLITVDCQYGERNVTMFPAKRIYQLDHHNDSQNGYDGEINSGLGSCSTLVWLLLLEAGFSFNEREDISTALYYGLYSDTACFEEISHPHDKDMRDQLAFDKKVFNYLRNNNLTIEDLRIAGKALTRYKLDLVNGYAIFEAEACDANMLGFISDLALQVEDVDVCVVYSPQSHGYKLSVRSCTHEVMANDLAQAIADGGGHKRKAGGFVSYEKLGNTPISTYLATALDEYNRKFDKVVANNHALDVDSMPQYKKKRIPQGCVLSSSIFMTGTPMLIRTLEGDSECKASEDVLLMINPEGEVYPISKNKFDATYEFTEEKFEKDFAYKPTVKNAITNQTVNLVPLARGCKPTGESLIHAKPIERHTKVFTKWNPDGYYLGDPGDFLAVRADDLNDLYIIKRHVFLRTYEQI